MCEVVFVVAFFSDRNRGGHELCMRYGFLGIFKCHMKSKPYESAVRGTELGLARRVERFFVCPFCASVGLI